MERRAYATGKQQWPDKKLTITSPPTTYAQYMSGELPKDDIINIMVGDLQRIIEYPRLGFQITQEVPEEDGGLCTVGAIGLYQAFDTNLIGSRNQASLASTLKALEVT